MCSAWRSSTARCSGNPAAVARQFAAQGRCRTRRPARIIHYSLALTPGTRLGLYEIVAPLGVGGMGEVYRASDSRLKRQVAIKVLPQTMAADPERLARFQREAEVLAALNHPNIAHIHGLDRQEGRVTQDGTSFLVMELVEG